MSYPNQGSYETGPLPNYPMIPPLSPSRSYPPQTEPSIIAPPQPQIHVRAELVWEHKTISLSADENLEKVDVMLNELGEKGWELCSAIPIKLSIQYSLKRRQPVSATQVDNRSCDSPHNVE